MTNGALDEEDEVDVNINDPFAMAVDHELEQFLRECTPSQEKWYPSLVENDIDLETLSTIDDDGLLRELGVEVLGARRRLLKEISDPKRNLQKKYPPTFYAYTNSEWVYLSWPPHATEEVLKNKRKQSAQLGSNPFNAWIKKKASAKIFRSMVRYAETKHFEAIRDRANKRYEADPEGTYKVWAWGAGTLGRLGHGYNVSYAIPTQVDTFPPQAKIIEVACGLSCPFPPCSLARPSPIACLWSRP